MSILDFSIFQAFIFDDVHLLRELHAPNTQQRLHVALLEPFKFLNMDEKLEKEKMEAEREMKKMEEEKERAKAETKRMEEEREKIKGMIASTETPNTLKRTRLPRLAKMAETKNVFKSMNWKHKHISCMN